MDFLKKNVSHFFSIIGISLTFYFSVYYIPDHYKEVEHEKQLRINEDLIKHLQEVVYNDYSITPSQIKSLIQGFEIRYNIKYKYNLLELYTQVQERFMSDKLIPLKIRLDLFKTIEKLKESLGEQVHLDSQATPVSFLSINYTSIFLTLLGVIASLLGAYGFYINIKRTQEADKMTDVLESTDDLIGTVYDGVDYEFMIKETINNTILEANVPATLTQKGEGFDFVLSIDENVFFIETKYYQNPIPVNIVHNIIGKLGHKNGDIFLFSNTRLSKSALDIIDKYNAGSKYNFYSISSTDRAVISKELFAILKPFIA